MLNLATPVFLEMFPFLQAAQVSAEREAIHIAVIVLQFMIALSILNVWVLQYDTIKAQFREFELPDWFRNAVGACKGLFCIMLIAGIWVWQLAVAGAIAIALMMVFAILTHIRAKDPFHKIVPAIVICVLCILGALLCSVYKFQG